MAPFKLLHTPCAFADIPKGSVILHAISGSGIWGKGIASELAAIFPAARIKYTEFCDKNKASPTDAYAARDGVTGRALLIPPQAEDVARGAPQVYIACIFTSYGSGKPDLDKGKPAMDQKPVILDQTAQALAHLRLQLEALRGDDVANGPSGTSLIPLVYSPRFNSGSFRVPWEETVAAIEEQFAGWDGSWVVFDRLQ